MIPSKQRLYVVPSVFFYFIVFFASIAISPAYAEPLYSVTGVTSDDVLNIRVGPGAKKSIVGAIPPNGKNIQVTGSGVFVGDTFWLPITYRDISGWVNGRYLIKTKNGIKAGVNGQLN